MEGRGEGGSAKGLKVVLNISRTFYQMGNYTEAQQYFARAQAIDPGQATQFAYLADKRPDEARAAEGRDPALEILFSEE
jgi:tetratricopeptide (TPR) repeat protein